MSSTHRAQDSHQEAILVPALLEEYLDQVGSLCKDGYEPQRRPRDEGVVLGIVTASQLELRICRVVLASDLRRRC